MEDEPQLLLMREGGEGEPLLVMMPSTWGTVSDKRRLARALPAEVWGDAAGTQGTRVCQCQTARPMTASFVPQKRHHLAGMPHCVHLQQPVGCSGAGLEHGYLSTGDPVHLEPSTLEDQAQVYGELLLTAVERMAKARMHLFGGSFDALLAQKVRARSCPPPRSILFTNTPIAARTHCIQLRL